jgi:hypothetical protein
MNDSHWECAKLLADLYRGFHHVNGKIRRCGPNSIEFNTANHSMGSFDSNQMTRLVLLCHRASIRAEINPSGPQMLKIVLSKRSRAGMNHERHPTIDEAIRDFNNEFPPSGLPTMTPEEAVEIGLGDYSDEVTAEQIEIARKERGTPDLDDPRVKLIGKGL